MIAWFTQNPGFKHDKLIPIPIGLENTVWNPNKEQFIRNVTVSSLIPWHKRKYLLYINFDPNTNRKAREYLLSSYGTKIKNLLITKRKVSFETYLNQIGDSKYVLCPRGNGLDTHRFYETILMGSVPVVENSTLYPIYKQATVLVLNDFKSLSQNMLDNPDLFIKNMNFSRDILMAETWLRKLDSMKKSFS